MAVKQEEIQAQRRQRASGMRRGRRLLQQALDSAQDLTSLVLPTGVFFLTLVLGLISFALVFIIFCEASDGCFEPEGFTAVSIISSQSGRSFSSVFYNGGMPVSILNQVKVCLRRHDHHRRGPPPTADSRYSARGSVLCAVKNLLILRPWQLRV